jgi:hypothetical protein
LARKSFTIFSASSSAPKIRVPPPGPFSGL